MNKLLKHGMIRVVFTLLGTMCLLSGCAGFLDIKPIPTMIYHKITLNVCVADNVDNLGKYYPQSSTMIVEGWLEDGQISWYNEVAGHELRHHMQHKFGFKKP